MIEHQTHARAALQVIVHDDPDLHFDLELFAEKRQQVRIAARNAGLTNPDPKSGTQRRQLR